MPPIRAPKIKPSSPVKNLLKGITKRSKSLLPSKRGAKLGKLPKL